MVINLYLIFLFSNLFISDDLIIKECENYFFRKIEIYLQVLFVLKLKMKKLFDRNEKKITNIYSVSSSEKGIRK